MPIFFYVHQLVYSKECFPTGIASPTSLGCSKYKAYCHLTHPFIFRAVSKPRAPSLLYAAPTDLARETPIAGTCSAESASRAGGWLTFFYGASDGKGPWLWSWTVWSWIL